MQTMLALALVVGIPAEAVACGASPSFAIIHSALPHPLPEGVIAAEIEIETDDPDQIYGSGLRIRIKKVIAGGPVGEVRLRLPTATSCDSPFANGRSGLFVGIAKQRLGAELIVWPILVSRYEDFRLPEGFSLTKERPYGPQISE